MMTTSRSDARVLRPVLVRKQSALGFEMVPIVTKEEAQALVRYLRAKKPFCAWDTETVACRVENEGPVNKAVCVSFSLCFAEDRAFYVPCYGPYREMLQHFTPWLEDPRCPKAGHNIRFDMHVAKNHGIDVRGVVLDTQVAEWLYNENERSYRLEDCVERAFAEKYADFRNTFTYCAIAKGNGKGLRHKKPTPITDLLARINAGSQHHEPGKLMLYGAKDAWIEYRLALRTREKLESKIWFKPRNAEKPPSTLKDYYNIFEAPYLNTLYAMERRGVTVDVAHMQRLDAEWEAAIDVHAKSFIQDCLEAGAPQHVLKELNLASTPQLTRLFFQDLKLPVGKKTEKGACKLDRAEIDRLIDEGHTVLSHFAHWRKLVKLRNTYAMPLQNVDQHRRIYTSFKQHGTVTGRLAVDKPNLQNIPARSEEGERLRQGFVARPGMVFVCADLSQIELRILAHYAQDQRMIAGFLGGEDFHALTARDMFPELAGCSIETIKTEHSKLRGAAKSINFGINYGMGAKRLAGQLKISVALAEEYMAKHDRTFPGINAFRHHTVMTARQHGFVQTYTLRFRNIPDINSNVKWLRMQEERRAFNSVIQGSAADIIKMSMICIHRDEELRQLNAHLVLQVHDELLLEAPEANAERVKEIVTHYMQEPYRYFGFKNLRVPTVADAHIGRNWLEAKG